MARFLRMGVCVFFSFEVQRVIGFIFVLFGGIGWNLFFVLLVSREKIKKHKLLERSLEILLYS